MIHASARVTVDRPVERCFDFVADLRNEPRFNPGANNLVKVTPGEVGLGTTYTEDVQGLGHVEVRTAEYDRPRLLRFDARNAKADVDVVFRFAPRDGGTEIESEVALRFKGASRLLEPLLGPIVRRVYEKERGLALKRAIESA